MGAMSTEQIVPSMVPFLPAPFLRYVLIYEVLIATLAERKEGNQEKNMEERRFGSRASAKTAGSLRAALKSPPPAQHQRPSIPTEPETPFYLPH